MERHLMQTVKAVQRFNSSAASSSASFVEESRENLTQTLRKDGEFLAI